MRPPQLSIVIPVYNEQENLRLLTTRLHKTLKNYGDSYEIIYVNDGSDDNTPKILHELHDEQPTIVRAINFTKNFGQHEAIMAGFEKVRGEIIVTLDADLQNPPEEIPVLLNLMKQGYDYVGGIRKKRRDNLFRCWASKLNNKIRYKMTKIDISDQGCMMRAYRRDLIDLLVQTTINDPCLYIPAQAYNLSSNPIEVKVEHCHRQAGESKYNLYRLLRLNFDLMTSFSLLPLQIFTMIGMFVSLLSSVFVAYLLIRRLVIGPEVEGVFTLFAIAFFLMGIILMGLGIVGEYIGRIYLQVRQQPRHIIKSFLKKD